MTKKCSKRKRSQRSPSLGHSVERQMSHNESSCRHGAPPCEDTCLEFPEYPGRNIIDWHIYKRLVSLWNLESGSWTLEERRHFITWARWATITHNSCTIEQHPISKYLERNYPSWGHFVILRAMFGSYACSTQKWWDNFKAYYPRATEHAPTGIVPQNVMSALETNVMKAPAMAPIPTMQGMKRTTRKPKGGGPVISSPVRNLVARRNAITTLNATGRNASPTAQQNNSALNRSETNTDFRSRDIEIIDLESEADILQSIERSSDEDGQGFEGGNEASPGSTSPKWSKFLEMARQLKHASTLNIYNSNQVRDHIKRQDDLILDIADLVIKNDQMVQAQQEQIKLLRQTVKRLRQK